MKKLYPVLLVLILAALAVAATFWRGQNQVASPMEQPITDVQNQVVEPQPASNPENKFDTAPVSTADWQTYNVISVGHKLSFEYSKDWVLSEGLDGAYLQPKPGGKGWGVSVSAVTPTSGWAKGYPEKSYNVEKNRKEQTFSYDGGTATRISGNDSSSKYERVYIVYRKNLGKDNYTVELMTAGDYPFEVEVLDHIMSTLKLTN
ncbi:MAG: hypothetical protein AAB880_01770 [Patescibacteria group bacterium]